MQLQHKKFHRTNTIKHTGGGEFSDEVVLVQAAQRATALLTSESQQPLWRAGVRVHLQNV